MAVFEEKTINFFLNKVSQVYKQNKNGQSSVLAMCERGKKAKEKEGRCWKFRQKQGYAKSGLLRVEETECTRHNQASLSHNLNPLNRRKLLELLLGWKNRKESMERRCA